MHLNIGLGSTAKYAGSRVNSIVSDIKFKSSSAGSTGKIVIIISVSIKSGEFADPVLSTVRRVFQIAPTSIVANVSFEGRKIHEKPRLMLRDIKSRDLYERIKECPRRR